MSSKTVAVVGGAGHVGLPFAIAASKAHVVYIIDKNEKALNTIVSGELPFIEYGDEIYSDLEKGLYNGTIRLRNYSGVLKECDYVVITMGTPVDAEGNGRVDDIIKYFDEELIPNINRAKRVLVILRSTVAPGVSEILLKKLRKADTCAYLIYAPERVLQTRAYEEITKLPQIIGIDADGGEIFKPLAEEFFFPMGVTNLKWLTYREAECAKLVTNMARYVEFALANEFYMLADRLSTEEDRIDMHKVIETAKEDYPRLAHLPLPGPNVGGPCLFKDGKFLLKNSPFNGLISTAFNINEGMPQFLFDKAKKEFKFWDGKTPKKIAILGMTFKADCDDPRNSLSFKLKKIAQMEGIEVVCVDPYLYSAPPEGIKDCDIIFLMTPHVIFKDWRRLLDQVPIGTLLVDAWNFWNLDTPDGFYFKRDLD